MTIHCTLCGANLALVGRAHRRIPPIRRHLTRQSRWSLCSWSAPSGTSAAGTSTSIPHCRLVREYPSHARNAEGRRFGRPICHPNLSTASSSAKHRKLRALKWQASRRGPERHYAGPRFCLSCWDLLLRCRIRRLTTTAARSGGKNETRPNKTTSALLQKAAANARYRA